MTLTRELVRRFEQHQADAGESLLTHSLQVPGNPEGYALFREDPIRATLSTNPRAGWATQAYGATGQPVAAVRRVVEFFNARRVPARLRIVPDGFTAEQADALGTLGLRHVGFHTILWSPLPLPSGPPASVDIREVSTLPEMDAHIDVQLGVYGVPPDVIDRLRPLRRTWLGSTGRRFYLAYVDGRPAAEAALYWRADLAYLESAGTLPAYRRRGLQRALIHRRVTDATKLGCRIIIGGADFENESRDNQMACGLSVAYTTAIWRQRPEAMLAVGPP
jgi:GNAT superfamily N-acetyltransferase